MRILPLPAFKDNYIWAVVNDQLGQVIVVDPGDASPVLHFLNQYGLHLVAILVTHKHGDHTDGISALLDVYPGVPVYASAIEKLSSTTHCVEDGETIAIKQWPATFKVITIPGHTLGHVAYYAHPVLFSGDTLFGAGCGRVFEGTAEQMHHSLNKLVALPDDTLVYCGHEYTLSNLQFALHVEPDNEAIQQRIKAAENYRLNNQPSLPSLMGTEKKTNPFLRCTQQNVIASVEAATNKKLENSVDVFHELREWKNNFKA